MPKNVGVVLTLKDRFSPKIKQVAENTGRTTKEIQKASMTIQKFQNQVGKGFQTAVAGLSAGIGAIAGTSYALATKTAEAGDRIDKMSQKIGMSRKGFQEWDYIMSQNGGSVDSLQMGYKTLATQMGKVATGSKESSALFNKLGVAVKDSSGKLRSQDEVFNDTVRALQGIQNPTEKAIMAQKLFGKSAIELKPLLNQSAESVDALRKKANDLGMVIGDDIVDASVKFQDTQDTLNRAFGAIGMTIGGELIPIMQNASDFIMQNMPKIKEVAQTVLGGLTGTLKFLIDHMNIIIPIASACVGSIMAFQTITTVVNVISTLQRVIQAVSIAQGIWNALMLANPIGLIAMGIGALIGVVVLLIANWDKITKAVGKAIAKMKEFLHLGKKSKDKGAPEVNVSDSTETSDGQKPSKHALGTPYFQGGATSINEGGRGEIVNLPSGSQIIPHDIAKQSSNKTINLDIKFNVQGNMIGNRELFDNFAEMLLDKVQNKLQTV